jgi:hypothetical protein
MRRNPVSKSLFPLIIYFPILLKIVTSSIIKVIEYPSLHNCLTERSYLFAMAGKTCATAAAVLSYWMSNDAVWVESIVDPFGSLTRKGLIYFVLVRQGALINKKILYNLSPLLGCPDVEEGVRYNKLENFRYYI